MADGRAGGYRYHSRYIDVGHGQINITCLSTIEDDVVGGGGARAAGGGAI